VIKLNLCTSIRAETLSDLPDLLSTAFDEGSTYVEIRIDYLIKPDLPSLSNILKDRIDQCVLTYRSHLEGGAKKINEKDRINLIKELASFEPAYLDIELFALESNPDIVSYLSGKTQLIASWHDFDSTPNGVNLFDIMKKSLSHGGLSKIISNAQNYDDNITILSLYEKAPKGKLIAFCMGCKGIISRVSAPLLGSPFTYSSLGDSSTASGQIPVNIMRQFYEIIEPRL